MPSYTISLKQADPGFARQLDEPPQHFLRSSSEYAIMVMARKRGILVQKVADDPTAYVLISGSRCALMRQTEPFLSTIPRPRHNDKYETKSLLEKAGIATPAGRRFGPQEEEEIVAYFHSIGSACALKPTNANGGLGVVSGITTEQELRRAYAPISRRPCLVEQHIEGHEHRFLVIGGRTVAVARRLPANVVGDGRKTIGELIDEKNAARQNHALHKKHIIKKDKNLMEFLAKAGRSLDEIPDADQQVFLRSISNVSRGGDAEDVTDTVHPSFVEVAEQVWRCYPDRVIYGVDLIASDITRPRDQQIYGIIEVNNRPMLNGLHGCPTIGKSRDTISPLLDYLFGRTPKSTT